MRIVECVINISEGQRHDVIDALAGATADMRNVALLDVHSDPWHNRSVFTLAGEPTPCLEAATALTRVAIDRIDLNRHHGVHPRVGAVDVVPFVPVQDTDLDECVALAQQYAARTAEDCRVPVFLYGAAATHPDRQTIASIRRGGYETLRHTIGTIPSTSPDFGPMTTHPQAGAIIAGAREYLVAFNVFLENGTQEVAAQIARTIRSSNGGMPGVQALGFLVNGQPQVSTNLIDLSTTKPVAVFEAVSRLADAARCGVSHSEFVGLVPTFALSDDATTHLGLRRPIEDHLLEEKIRQHLG